MKGEPVSVWTAEAGGELGFARATVSENAQGGFDVAAGSTPAAPGTPVLDSVGDVVGIVRRATGAASVASTPTLEKFLKGESGVHPFGPAARFIRPRGGADLSAALDTAPDLAGSPDATETPATKLRLLNNPSPHFTEAARQSRTQGKVVMRVRFGANGKVARAVMLRGLPDGLTDEARVAIYKFQFTPATSAAGTPMDSSQTVSINFTIR
jgi:TonB family protein